MQHVVFDFDQQLFVSNTKQQFCLLLPVTWESTTVLIVLLGLQYVPCMAYLS